MPNQQTLAYIQKHRLEDPRKLALQSRPDGVDVLYALNQIAGWQAARQKLPTWAATEGIVYPPHLSMEQCSSEATAIYKRGIVQRLLDGRAQTLVDITGGFGVDFSYLATDFANAVYVERQQVLCDAAIHNLPLLGLGKAQVVCADGTEYLRGISRVSMIFVDPARRDGNGGRTYGIADCTPNVAALKSEFVRRADYTLVKLSPMLDWHKAVEELGCVCEVHIVSVKNECKELLLVIDGRKTPQEPLRLYCVNCLSGSDNSLKASVDVEEFTIGNGLEPMSATFTDPMEGMYLYEPNASLMKSGCFAALSQRYGMGQIAPDSHLFVSEEAVDFPGRHFRVSAVVGTGKKDLRAALQGVRKANIATRNFPMSVSELRKRLKLSDGGDCYIFATTLRNDRHVLLVCEKA